MAKKTRKKDIKNPVIIEGLPGMGNVGKIAVDFIVDSVNATKYCEVTSKRFPSCVFVDDDNNIELPKVALFHKKIKTQDFIFVSGDIQPVNELGCYEFCEQVLKLFPKVKEVVTLGGIGLEELPLEPKLYVAGTSRNVVTKYKLSKAKGNVGPIFGVSGILVGMARERKIPGVILLAQTLAHPQYLAIKGSRGLLKVLNHTWKLGLNMRSLNREVKEIEAEIKDKVERVMMLKEDKGKEHMTYIG